MRPPRAISSDVSFDTKNPVRGRLTGDESLGGVISP
jgi:hypothetical protein